MANEALFERLKHPNPNLRDRAMMEIAENQDEKTIPALMAALDSEDTVYRRAAVKTLGVVGIDAVSPLVKALQTSENVTVRGSAVKALTQVILNYPDEEFPQEGLDALKLAINDPNPVVNIATVMTLGEIGTPMVPLLIETLETTDNPALAVTIVNTLGTMADERCAKILQQLSQDDNADSYVRETAVSALSRLEFLVKNQPK